MEDQLSGYPAAERKYIGIRRNYSLLENLYIFLLQKRAEASISRAASTSDIVMVNPPMAGAPISPKPAQNYLIAGVSGLALPLLVFILMEIFNTRIQSKDDIERFTSIPFIGGVGHKTTPDNRSVLLSPKSAVAESFRALRSNLTYFLGDKQKATVLITSSISGEGKTFTTINLASVFALSGKKTLVLGADMRKPKLFGDFGLPNNTGLSTYLVGLKEFEGVVQKTAEPNLDLVSGGPVPPNPSELVLTGRMKKFFEEARQRYDYIIIDSPPLAIVADAFVLADHADHMIFVTRQDHTPKQLLKSLDEHYRNGRLKNISLLLNDIFKSGPGYGYGYSYGYGYGYGYRYSKRKNGDGYYVDD
jgi:capsular exopolysaccharide synthesis family protein